MLTLKQIGQKFKTDKVNDNVNYTKAYEKYFEPLRDKKLKILEIGVGRLGAGLLTWNEYFKNSQIYGMDNWKKVSDYTGVTRNMLAEGIEIFRGDQSNVTHLKSLVEKYGNFDIIIDDGGHTMLQQQLTLGHLFQHLNKNGIYVIEDLVTSHWGFKNDSHKDFHIYRSTPDSQNVTTLNYLLYLQNNRKSVSSFLTFDQSDYIEENLDFCEVFEKTADYERDNKKWNAGIGFIKKK